MDSDVWQSAQILLRRFVYGVHEGNHLAGNLCAPLTGGSFTQLERYWAAK